MNQIQALKTKMTRDYKILQVAYCELLNDFELISAITYCRNLVQNQYSSDFEDFCTFFFDGNSQEARSTISNVREIYAAEYFRRHIN